MPDIAIPAGFEIEAAPQAVQAQPNGVPIPEGFELEGAAPATPQAPKPQRGAFNALTGADGGERYQTWPEKLVRGVGSAISDAAHLPGDALAGRVQPGSDEEIGRAFNMATLTSPANPAIRGGQGGMGAMVTPTEGQAATSAGKRIGVDIPVAAASDSATVQRAGKVVSAVPLLGDSVVKASERATGQLGEAASRAEALPTGAAVGPQQAGEATKGAIVNWIGPRSKEVAERIYSKVDDLVDKEAKAPLIKTGEVAQNILSRRQNAAITAPSDAVKRIEDAVTRPEGLNYQGVKDLRSYIGELMNSSVLPADLSKQELKQIYGALSEDYRNITAAAGGQQAKDALVRADKIFQSISERRESLAKIVGESGDAAGEAIFGKIKTLASTGNRADAATLQQARKAAGPEAWSEISAAVIGTLGKNRKGEWDPNIFLNDFAKLSGNGKQVLFKSTNNEKVLPFLNDIAAVSKRFNQWNRFENTSRTGSILTGSALGAQALATGKAALGGAVMEPLTFIAGIVGTSMLSKALASPATAAPTAKFARAYVAMTINPNAQSVASFSLAARNLANSIGVAPAEFMRKLQSPVPVPANESEAGGEQKN